MKAIHIVSSIFILLAFCLLAIISVPADAFSPVDAVVTVDCLAVKDSEGMTYTIVLEPISKGAPRAVTDTLRIREDGTGRFTIHITEPGTYKYKLYEKKENSKNIEYDPTVYNVTVYVEETVDDNLVYSVTVANGDSAPKTDRVEFANIVLGETETNTTAPAFTLPAPNTNDSQMTTAVTNATTDHSNPTDVQTTTVGTGTNGGETNTETVTEPVSTDPNETNPETTNDQDVDGPDNPDSTTTTTTTVETTTTESKPDSSITIDEYLTNVLTGDRTPLSFLIGGLSAAVLIGSAAVLLKKRKDE